MHHPILVALGLATCVSAQGAANLSGAYFEGRLATEPTGSGGCASGLDVAVAGFATVAFPAPDQWTRVGSSHLLCRGVGNITPRAENHTGTHSIECSGNLERIAAPPGIGGEEPELSFRATGDIAISSREASAQFPGLVVMIKQSVSAPPAAGTWHFARMVHDAAADRIEAGVLNLLANGTWSETITRCHAVTHPGGVATSSGCVGGSGSWSVGTDGQLTLDSLPCGAISSDGSVLFAMRGAAVGATSVAMTVAIRAAPAASAQGHDGDWIYSFYGVGPWSGSCVSANTGLAWLTGAPTTTVDGTLQGAFFELETCSGWTGASAGVAVADYRVGAGGVLEIGTPVPELAGAISADGAVSFLATAQAGGELELAVGLRGCGATSSYGTGTAGTSGVPGLSPAGLAFWGNATFGYRVELATTTTVGLVAVALSPGTGLVIPGVGSVWLPLVPVPVTLAVLMPGGVGTVSLPLPAGQPVMADLDLYAQAFVLDGSGLAASGGLRTEVVR